MKITAKLNFPRAEIELEGEDRTEIQSELLELVEFINENEEQFERVGVVSEPKTADEDNATQTTLDSVEPGDNTRTNSADKLESISPRRNVDTDTLSKFLELPDSENEVPILFLDGFEEEEEVLGSSRREKQARASLVLLKAWREILDLDPVPSPDLNDALHASKISPKNRKDMYDALSGDADAYFSRGYDGNVGLTQAGRRAADDEIERLISEFKDS